MNSRRIALFAALAAFIAAPMAHAQVDACFKNHYILAEPCAFEWTAVNVGLADLDVRIVAIDPVNPATLYAGGPTGIFKSIDGAATWHASGLLIATARDANYPFPFVAQSIVTKLAIDPANPLTLYAGTNPG